MLIKIAAVVDDEYKTDYPAQAVDAIDPRKGIPRVLDKPAQFAEFFRCLPIGKRRRRITLRKTSIKTQYLHETQPYLEI